MALLVESFELLSPVRSFPPFPFLDFSSGDSGLWRRTYHPPLLYPQPHLEQSVQVSGGDDNKQKKEETEDNEHLA